MQQISLNRELHTDRWATGHQACIRSTTSYAVAAGNSYNGESGALISQIGNRDLTWEKHILLVLGSTCHYIRD